MEERLIESEAKDINDLKKRIWAENKKIWKVGFPATLARVSQYGMFVVTQSFIGHVGELELAGYALIQIITVRFANGILVKTSKSLLLQFLNLCMIFYFDSHDHFCSWACQVLQTLYVDRHLEQDNIT